MGGCDMTEVRVLVGTQKGGFVLRSDGRRADWEVSGPHFGGWEVYHMVGAPSASMRVYASQSTGWFADEVVCAGALGVRRMDLPAADPVELGTPAFVRERANAGGEHPKCPLAVLPRSEERRVGKECRSR